MKKLILVLVVLNLSIAASARSASVRTYIKKNGTVVAGHQRTTPNNTKLDNYSQKGNIDPYTGKEGVKK